LALIVNPSSIAFLPKEGEEIKKDKSAGGFPRSKRGDDSNCSSQVDTGDSEERTEVVEIQSSQEDAASSFLPHNLVVNASLKTPFDDVDEELGSGEKAMDEDLPPKPCIIFMDSLNAHAAGKIHKNLIQ